MDKQHLDNAMRVLWALCERAGGTITISELEAKPVSGAIHVSWVDGQITVSVAEKHGDKKQ